MSELVTVTINGTTENVTILISEDIGPRGLTGAKGDTGDSAYAAAVALGFGGTQSDWLATLIGPQGPQGEKGEAGSAAGLTNADVNAAIAADPAATRTALALGSAAQADAYSVGLAAGLAIALG